MKHSLVIYHNATSLDHRLSDSIQSSLDRRNAPSPPLADCHSTQYQIETSNNSLHLIRRSLQVAAIHCSDLRGACAPSPRPRSDAVPRRQPAAPAPHPRPPPPPAPPHPLQRSTRRLRSFTSPPQRRCSASTACGARTAPATASSVPTHPTRQTCGASPLR